MTLVNDTDHSATNPTKDFHVLALSGGGFRGLYTATVLAELEAKIGPLGEKFDLICGTSVGGLLALGLAKGIKAEVLQKLFIDHGTEIFSANWCNWIPFFGHYFSRHTDAGLRRILTELFDEAVIGDLQHPVLVPTVNTTKGQGQIFKTPHNIKFEMDHEVSLVDLALATTAAPTYFPMFRNANGTFVDGGLMANSPGFFGYHEAKHFMGADPSAVKVLSVGTMSSGASVRSNGMLSRGILSWKGQVVDLIFSVQEGVSNELLKHEIGDRHFKVDSVAKPEQIKDVSKLNLVSDRARTTYLNHGKNSAQSVLGDARFSSFRAHVASKPTFFHGNNKNT